MNSPLYTGFVDYEKAFESIDGEFQWGPTQDKLFKGNILRPEMQFLVS